jgi:hypothetical protein
MMKDESVRSALETVASNPKVASAAAAVNISLGSLVWMDVAHGLLSLISLGVGIVTGLVILGIQLIRLEQAWRARQAGDTTSGGKS